MIHSLDGARTTPIEDVVGSRLKLQSAGRIFSACCPFHDDHTPSFYLYPETNRFWCFGCGVGGDVIDFVMRFDGCTFTEAIQNLVGCKPNVASLPSVPKVSKDEEDRSEFPRQIYEGACSIVGTIGQRYLSNRGINLEIDAEELPLRFDYLTHPETRQRHPTIISRIENTVGHLTGIQRTFLTDDGFKLPGVKAKLCMGNVRGSATKLSPANDEIIICEGLEDGLSLQAEIPEVAVWVAAGTSNLSRIQLPANCNRVTIAADNDDAGRSAAEAAAESYLGQGFDARIIYPDHRFKDFNEQHQKACKP